MTDFVLSGPAFAALDELEDATAAAIATLQSLITRNAARNVEHF